jgi:hypothetical protein
MIGDGFEQTDDPPRRPDGLTRVITRSSWVAASRRSSRPRGGRAARVPAELGGV